MSFTNFFVVFAADSDCATLSEDEVLVSEEVDCGAFLQSRYINLFNYFPNVSGPLNGFGGPDT